MSTMLYMLRYWVVVIAGIALGIPVGAWALNQLKASDGALGAPLVLCDRFLYAGIVMLLASASFLVISTAVAKLTHRYGGLLVYGVSWVLVARKSLAIDDVVRQIVEDGQSARGVFFMFAIESAVWFIPVGLLLLILSRRWFENPDLDEAGPQTKVSARAFLIACAAGLILCWLAVRTDARGQALYGSMAAIAAAVMGVRLAWPRCHGLLLFFVPVVVGVIGHFAAAVMTGSDVLNIMADGNLFPLARPLPMDYINGGVVGVLCGIYLAHSFGAEPVHEANAEATESASPSA